MWREKKVTNAVDWLSSDLIWHKYPPWNEHGTWKWMVERLVSFWEGPFSGAMLVLGSVYFIFLEN